MALRISSSLIGSLALAIAVTPCVPSAQADLKGYVTKPDDSFSWKLKENHTTDDGKIYDLALTSQTWQRIKWEHQLQIYHPKDVKPGATMLLMNTGGGANLTNMRLGMEMAKRVKAPCAVLYHIPNQPIFDKKEDALIAETFVRFLEDNGKDESWPLLFPMVKSVVKAMDAIQEFTKQEWKEPVKHFVIWGASKRGWTTWLTAATGDPRVKAIAPLVIDTLNMPEQMDHQVKCFGGYSEMIKDYTERKLVPVPDTPVARKLWGMIDPYLYADKLTMPKFIINGNNDPYWTTDALNLYWDRLKGDKWVLYVPNAGHNLQQKDKVGVEQYGYVLNGLAAFARHQIADKPMHNLTWKHDDAEGKLRLTVEGSSAPGGARLWVATADTLDFRKAKWVEHPATLKDGKVIGLVEAPKEGCLAFYAELDYEIEDIKYHLSTQMRVAGKPKK